MKSHQRKRAGDGIKIKDTPGHLRGIMSQSRIINHSILITQKVQRRKMAIIVITTRGSTMRRRSTTKSKKSRKKKRSPTRSIITITTRLNFQL